MNDPTSPGPSPQSERPKAAFATTRWSLVAAAGRHDTAGRAALTTLCETYWYPIYAFLRRQGASADDATDLTQGFFADILERDELHLADATRGRFRAFLLTCARNFLNNQRDRERALKRGGGRPLRSLDQMLAEERYQHETTQTDPEQQFIGAWARTLLEKVHRELRDQYRQEGKEQLFEQLRPGLAGEATIPYRQLAEQQGTTEAAVKSAAHRLRQRFAAMLQGEIANTLQDGDDVQGEIAELFAALRND